MRDDPDRGESPADQDRPYAPWRPPPGQPLPERFSKPIAAPRSDLFGGVVFGLAGAVIGALAWMVAAGPLALTWGLVGMGVIVGWLVGSAVGWGAWNRAGPRRTHPVVRLLAIALGVLAWLGGTYLAYLWKLAVAAQAGEPIAQRIAEQDFPRWLPSQFGPLEVAELVAIALFAWRSSR
jgi:hypothetical protein